MKSNAMLRLLLVVGCLSSTPAWATDFSVTVPMQASGLPSTVNKMAVSCQILTDVNSVVIGTKTVYLPIKGGAFRGDVLVPIDAKSGANPALATRYWCVAWFMAELPSGTIYFYSQNTEDGVRFQRFPLVSGAPFMLDTGYLPLPR